MNLKKGGLRIAESHPNPPQKGGRKIDFGFMEIEKRKKTESNFQAVISFLNL